VEHRRYEKRTKPLDSPAAYVDTELPTLSEEITADQLLQNVSLETADQTVSAMEHSGVSTPKPKDFMKPKVNTVSGTRRSRRAHDELRRRQISQPLRAVAPRWPTEMTPADKQLFKACAPAVKLLIKLGYANDTNW